MPLPIPNLDDTQFQTMAADALTAIPRYAPEWTDYNLHDPGITFIDLFAWLAEMQQYYLNRIRIERAKILLDNSSLSVTDIAYGVGFQSLTHFNRTFRKVVCVSPTEYRLRPLKKI